MNDVLFNLMDSVNIHMTIHMNVIVKPEKFNNFLHWKNKQHLFQQELFQLENDIFYYLNYLKKHQFEKPMMIEIAIINKYHNFKNKESLLNP